MQYHAVLIDTVSIQRYVFGSNKLKENLGASYLIGSVYDSQMKEALRNVLDDFDESAFDLWLKRPDYSAVENGSSFEPAYIGGGNAMLFFMDRAKAESFIREWTKRLLISAPGLNNAAAIGEFGTDNFRASKKELFRSLARSKSQYIPQTIIPRHGITAECSHSGYSMDIYSHSEGKYLSSVINAKLDATKESKEKTDERFSDVLEDKYCFTDELDKLGQTKGEGSHIAVVHIDGNSMADRFTQQDSLKGIRELSKSVNEATINAVKSMIQAIKDNKDMLLNFFGSEGFQTKNGKEILPFRPIIIGGDDITFAAEGRIGIWLAEQFLIAFEKQTVSDGKSLDASAGIAIIKTKYPFYRGYALSEELCKSAKLKRKGNGSKGSWIDFNIAFGGISGSLEHIRVTQYNAAQGSLLMRPYCIGSDKPGLDFNTLKKNAKTLAKLPNNKIKDMRQILTLGKEQTKMFVAELQARGDGDKIPEIEGQHFKDAFFENSVTPYFDMIELMEFYPGLKEAEE